MTNKLIEVKINNVVIGNSLLSKLSISLFEKRLIERYKIGEVYKIVTISGAVMELKCLN